MARTIQPRVISVSLNEVCLAIDADWEPLTTAAANYRETNVYPYLRSKGFQVDVFRGAQAERYYVAPETVKPNVTYLTGCGHGNVNVYTGYFNHPVFMVGAYAATEVKGKIAHFLSCLTAQQLGPDFVVRGCRAYFGYDQDFVVLSGDYEDYFFECDSAIDLGFAAGLTASEVYVKVAALYRQRAAELRAKGTSGGIYAANVLDYDLAHLMCPSTGARWGDVNAKLS